VAGLAVVHLVRKQNGFVPFERFLKSYRQCAAVAPHELVVLYKGFRNADDVREHEALLGNLPYRAEFIPDHGYDLHAYFGAVQRLDYERFCFLNSYSRILAHGWLDKLEQALSDSGVGLVGATGSWQSMAGGYTDRQRLVSAQQTARMRRERVVDLLQERRPGMRAQRAWNWILRGLGVWRPTRDFPPYPNYHLRTNAFMGARATLLRIRLEAMRIKQSAYKFESGNNSMTRQVFALGLSARVVGADGRAYAPEQWHLSNTFWQSRQENLLVADNQTELYAAANADGRHELADLAWGESARPA